MDMKMIINGEFVDSSDGKVTNNINPYTGEVIGTVPAATKEDVDRAIAYAVEGQKVWSAMRCDERDVILNRFIKLVEENLEDIARLESAETGKTITECRNEVKLVPLVMQAYMHAAATLYGQYLPNNVEPRNAADVIFTKYEPIGVCVCVGPYNFPVATMNNKVAPALCAGNAVIMKPASDTPMSTLLYAKLMLDAGMPKNVISVVTGSGGKMGSWFTSHKDVALISLTGSTEVGVTVQREASEQLKRCHLELGGNDPLIIFEDADLDRAVGETLTGRLRAAGQICTGSKRLIVHNSLKEEYTRRLIEKLSTVKFGDPADESVEMGTLINARAANTVMEQIEHTINQGAKCLHGGKKIGDTFVEPTVLVDVTPDMDVAKDMEIFGPVYPIIGFDTFEEAIEIANNTTYGLSSGIITENMRIGIQAAYALKAGMCVINGSGNYRSSYLSFGGYKMSGVGREGALETLKEFSEVKNIVLRQVLS